MGWPLVSRPCPSHPKQQQQHPVDHPAKERLRHPHAPHSPKPKAGDEEGGFLQHGQRHQDAEARGIAADQQEEQLPDDGRAVKAVVKFRMRDGRRVQRVEAAFGKQSRHQYQQAINPGPCENPPCKCHCTSLPVRKDQLSESERPRQAHANRPPERVRRLAVTSTLERLSPGGL